MSNKKEIERIYTSESDEPVIILKISKDFGEQIFDLALHSGNYQVKFPNGKNSFFETESEAMEAAQEYADEN